MPFSQQQTRLDYSPGRESTPSISYKMCPIVKRIVACIQNAIYEPLFVDPVPSDHYFRTCTEDVRVSDPVREECVR